MGTGITKERQQQLLELGDRAMLAGELAAKFNFNTYQKDLLHGIIIGFREKNLSITEIHDLLDKFFKEVL